MKKKSASMRQVMVMRNVTLKAYAKFIRKTTETARKYIKHPLTMSAATLKRTDKFFNLPDGTSYEIASGKFTTSELINKLNNNN